MESKLLTSLLKKDDLFRGFNFRASQDRVQNTEQPAPVNSRRNSFQFSKVASYAGRLRSQFCLRPCRRRLLETRAKKLRRGRLKNWTKETGSLVTRCDKSKLSVGSCIFQGFLGERPRKLQKKGGLSRGPPTLGTRYESTGRLAFVVKRR